MKRIILYAKDIQVLTGKSERSSRDLMKKIRQHYNKQNSHAITVDEFCDYMGIRQQSLSGLGLA